MKLKSLLIFCLSLTLMLVGCDKDNYCPKEITSKDNELAGVNVAVGERNSVYAKLFVLAEGQMGSNNASLGFLRYRTGYFINHAFKAMNPTLLQGLGDVANDLAISNSLGVIAVTESGIVEVINTVNEHSIATIAVPQPRYVAIHSNYAYISSHKGKQVGANMLGTLYTIDLNKLNEGNKAKVDSCEVGYTPEGVAYYNGNLYVANSGGWKKDYDNRLMVIDAKTLKIKASIVVEDNIIKVFISNNDIAWVSSPGNYSDKHSGLYLVDLKTNTLIDRSQDIQNIRVKAIDFNTIEQKLYVLGSEDEYDWKNAKTYKLYIVDATTKQVTVKDFPKGVEPYALCYNEQLQQLYVTDAKNYTGPGVLYCFDKDLKMLWNTRVGVCPGTLRLMDNI